MFYWVHIGIWSGAKTCKTCGNLIGKGYGKSVHPSYDNPVHKNCRCVWWRIERIPTLEEVRTVIFFWSYYFELVRKWYGGGDIEKTRKLMKFHAEKIFEGDFISTTIPIEPGPVPSPSLITFDVSPFAATIVNEVEGTCPVSEKLVADREYAGIVYDSRLGEPADDTRAIESFKLYVNTNKELADAAYLAFETGVQYAFDCDRLSSIFSIMPDYDGYLVVNQAQKEFKFIFTTYPVPFEEFIANTFDASNQVIIGSKLLYFYLTHKIVSDYWWNLSDAQRAALATVIIDQYSIPIGVHRMCREGENCGGCDYTSNCGNAWCGAEMMVRLSWLSSGMYNDTDIFEKYYWRELDEWNNWVDKTGIKNLYFYSDRLHKVTKGCLWKPRSLRFDLPCYAVQSTAPGHSHWICAIQIKENGDNFDSYQFFQYEQRNLIPGENWQLPLHGTAKFRYITQIWHYGSSLSYDSMIDIDY